MRRRLFKLLTGLSLLLFLLVAAAWVRGYFVGDRWAVAYAPVTGVTTSPWGETTTWRARHVLNSGGGRLQWVRIEYDDARHALKGHSTAPPSQVILDLLGSAKPADRWGGVLGFGYFVR